MDEILSLLTSPIAIHPDHFNSLKLALFSAIKTGQLADFKVELKKGDVKAKAITYQSANMVDEWDIMDDEIPENSIAMILIEGIVYPWKTFQVEKFLQKAIDNPNIIGILFFVNTPGGYTHRVDVLADAIKKCQIPTAAYVTGICTSAGMYMFSGVNRIFSASKTDVFGSIGVMTTYTDSREFWKEMGFIDTDIYATLSTEKNLEIREAEKGNFEPIVKNLDFLNDLFHKTISENLGIPIDTESHVFKGATFFTEEAISLGLAHQIASLNEALNWVTLEAIKMQANQL